MTTQPSDWAVAPKFGEWLRGIYASERNPLRDGMYVRTIRRTGRCNPGTFYELTDGKGKFWQYPRQSVIRLDRARELDASGTTNSAQISSEVVVGDTELLNWLATHLADAHGIYQDANGDPVSFDYDIDLDDDLRGAIRAAMGAVGAGGGE